MTPAEHAQSAALTELVRREWKNAGDPEARAEVEQAVRGALSDRANRVIRRATDRCPECGDPDKDKRIKDLEKDLAAAQEAVSRAGTLLDRKRKTVRTDDLRTALNPEEAA